MFTKERALTLIEIVVEEMTERGLDPNRAVEVGKLIGFLLEPEFGKDWLDEFKK